MGRLFAVADIGSNTAHLLVAEVTGKKLRRLANESDWLSLGEVVARLGRIPRPLEDRLVATLKEFRQIATNYKAGKPYIFATEAMRRAENCEIIRRRLRAELGLEVEIIDPTREAYLSLCGILPEIGKAPLLMVEAGGGSVQVARWDGNAVASEDSLPLGTGVLIANSELGQPATPDQVQRLESEIAAGLAPILGQDSVPRIVACGGVARGIWRALHPDGDPVIHAEELEFLAWSAQRLTVDQIVSRYRVKARRAATLLPGSLVYLRILSAFAHDLMYVSEFGVREGAIFELAARAPGVSK